MNAIPLTLAGEPLLALASGALFLPERRLLVVSDLHLGKAGRRARLGAALLPPYETKATLERLGQVIHAHAPAMVVCLGDSFDDSAAAASLAADDLALLWALQAGRDWIWIRGNHDRAPTLPFGQEMDELEIGPLVLRHQALAGPPPASKPFGLPEACPPKADQARTGATKTGLENAGRTRTGAPDGMPEGLPDRLPGAPVALAAPEPAVPSAEISGHYHPKASVSLPGHAVSRPCFLVDGARMILPAFGAYTGGLSCLAPELAALMRPEALVILTGTPQLALPLAGLAAPRRRRPARTG